MAIRVEIRSSGSTAGTGTSGSTAIDGATGAVFSALTKCCMPCVWHAAEAGWDLWQQLCAAVICGQERQFPQSIAASTRATVNEMENFRTKSQFIREARHIANRYADLN